MIINLTIADTEDGNVTIKANFPDGLKGREDSSAFELVKDVLGFIEANADEILSVNIGKEQA